MDTEQTIIAALGLLNTALWIANGISLGVL